jgi:hypothetical protein
MNPIVRVTLLMIHGLSAVTLLGAITHQALAVWWTPRPPASGWWHALRSVHPERYASAIVTLFVVTMLLGTSLYPSFRVDVRPGLDTRAPWGTGLFELKEHGVAIGLALLPAYWCGWRSASGRGARRALTTFLAIVIWWAFLAGQIVNNLHGL